MKLLAEGLADPQLARMYSSLLASEARHHQTYIDLAATQIPESEVYSRLEQIGEHEARVLETPGTEIRLHS